MLLAANANVNLQCENGNTPLMIACKYGYFEIVKLLIIHFNANVCITNEHGFNVFHFASMMNQYKIVRFICKHLIQVKNCMNNGKVLARIIPNNEQITIKQMIDKFINEKEFEQNEQTEIQRLMANCTKDITLSSERSQLLSVTD